MRGTIKSKADMERLFRTGRRSSSSLMLLIVSTSPDSDGDGRCAFIAGKKLGSAPTRERCKRVMREASRELGAPWQGCDVVFVARRKVAFAQHGRVVYQMREHLLELGVLL